jgi:hypothetical protein
MLWVLASTGVICTVHVEVVAVAGLRVHCLDAGVNVSLALSDENVTIPAGGEAVPTPAASATVTVAVVDCPTTTLAGDRLTEVVVARVFTVSGAATVVELLACTLGETAAA